VETTRLSTKGQVIIPKPLRAALRWRPGQELEVIETQEGVLLRPKAPFKPTRLEDVAGILKYDGPPVSDKQIEARLTESLRKEWRGRR
jgi:AbrB family looped-hinge helix DNA binding protein